MAAGQRDADGAAIVTFDPPTNARTAQITSYSVRNLKTNQLKSTTASPITFTGLKNGTSYTFAVTASNSNGTSDPIITAAVTPLCEGTSTDIQVAASEVGITYQLRNDFDDSLIGASVAGTGGTILLPTGNLSVTTIFNVLASNGTCSIELTDNEAVNVDVAPDPSLTVAVSINPLCVGGTSAVTVALSEVGVTYQLRNESYDSNVGASVVGTGGTISLSTGVLATTTTFNILASSGGTCADVELTTLATVTVGGTIDNSLTVSSTVSPICAGSSTFIQVANSEAGVNYQLRNDAGDVNIGSAVAGTGGIINLPTGNLAATTTFNVLASNGICSIELLDTEIVTVNPSPSLSLSVTALSSLFCSGTSTSIIFGK